MCALVAAQVEPRFRPYDGRVHGVLYRVTQKDFEKLAKREGGYVVQEVQVGVLATGRRKNPVWQGEMRIRLARCQEVVDGPVVRICYIPRSYHMQVCLGRYLSGVEFHTK